MTLVSDFTLPVSLEHSYVHYSPEIGRCVKQKLFTTHTLSTLSLKRSEQAEQAGYLKIRPTNEKAKLPAYWLHGSEKDAYLRCLQEIEKQRQDVLLKKKQKELDEQRKVDEAIGELDVVQQSIFLALRQKHPRAAIQTLISKVQNFGNVTAQLSSLENTEGAWFQHIVPELSSDESVQVSRIHIKANMVCPRPGEGELRIAHVLTKEIKNSITPRQLQTLLNDAHSEHLTHVQTLSTVSALAKKCVDLPFQRAFDTLFTKVCNGATPYDQLHHGLYQSLYNDLEGCSTFVSWMNDLFIKDGTDFSLHYLKSEHKAGIRAEFGLSGTSVRLYDVSLTRKIASWLLEMMFVDDVNGSLFDLIKEHLLKEQNKRSQSVLDAVAELNEKADPAHVLALSNQRRDFFMKQMQSRISEKNWTDAIGTAKKRTLEHFSLLLTMHDLKDKFGEDWILSRYVHARALNREIIIYAGPTNAGKTYHAFLEAYKGVHITYLAPLRLLAMEGYDRFVADGKNAYLITGEERIGDSGAPCVASTIEMCNLNQVYDVAIVDEAQMLIDPERGAAWTAALLGVAAKKVILTCPEESVLMLKNLFSLTNERVTVHELERKSPLVIGKSHAHLSDLKKGSALVAFSRRDLLSYKETLESKGLSCSLIYGALSPEVRRQQAKLFQDGETDVLLSTDAIAMGLNLPISTMIISSEVKFNGKHEVDVPPTLLRQIGGRAGRYGMVEGGVVMGLLSHVHQAVQKAFEHTPTFVLPHYPLGLDSVMVKVISEMISSHSLLDIQRHFRKIIDASHAKFQAKITQEQHELFELLDQKECTEQLSLQERFTLACAPVNDGNRSVWDRAVQAQRTNIPMRSPVSSSDFIEAKSDRELKALENHVSQLCLYRWLHYQFPETFPDLPGATEKIERLNDLIMQALSRRIKKMCQCGKQLSFTSPHSRCDVCYEKNKFNSSYY